MPPTKGKKPKYYCHIPWKNCVGKALLETGIKNGTIPDDMLARDVFAHYAHRREFSMLEKNDPATFARRLKSLRKSIKTVAQRAADDVQSAAADAAALVHDRAIYPERTHNDRGEQLWHNSKAKSLLRDDLAAGNYKKGKPQELRETRDEYKEFDRHKFAKRIHQEKQTKKWYESKQKRNPSGENDSS